MVKYGSESKTQPVAEVVCSAMVNLHNKGAIRACWWCKILMQVASLQGELMRYRVGKARLTDKGVHTSP